MQQVTGKLVLIVMGFDTLGVILAIALSIAWHGVIFDPLSWAMTFLPMCVLGTVVGVMQVMKTLR